ncbi:transglutaminase-like cysteine peptidase [Sulfurimonas sp. MAG313]|nr:transglutaminase-like cysteine peptidase [Sulfurimonas sp. MAG313]
MFILRLLIILLLTIHLNAFNNGPISEKIMKKAERKYGGKVINRFLKYNKLLAKIKPLDERNKLKIVNKFFNQVPYVRDIENWKQEDYWATPLEFLSRAKGDSEDFVIAKYFALKTSGVDTKKLYFTYVTSKERNEPHMVLSYFETPSSDPFILDNFNPNILSAKDRDDLSPVYNFSPSSSSPQTKPSQHSTHKKWEKLYKRVQRNKL